MAEWRYGFTVVTSVLFLASLGGHWMFAWFAYAQEQEEHGQPVEARDYVVETTRDTLENWQSEFLQLVWQVAGLAFLWHIGSSQSKEGDDRKEEKLDLLLDEVYGKERAKLLREQLDAKYPRH